MWSFVLVSLPSLSLTHTVSFLFLLSLRVFLTPPLSLDFCRLSARSSHSPVSIFLLPLSLLILCRPPPINLARYSDPFRDEGIAFYHTCLEAGVPRARCTTLNGTIHGIGTYIPGLCPEITESVVEQIAALAKR